ncbi:MAG: UDP-N-acetylmuramoyl-tripeptide--D-alanyl-D-alanine ligase [Chlamydiia bacterium]|nr:UDP-N-acetylmuramoyl-tripeptide--D-alanyl-D-alanine ligase [Chlamydiia bacterium]
MQIPISQIGKILSRMTESTTVINSYAIDSRKIEPGSLFFALKGKKFDGHDFLEDVARNGAYAAVVDKDYQGAGYGLELFFVDDVRDALQLIAKKMLQEKQIRVIGVTGSVGKTTTKEMIYHILSKKFKVHANKGSQNTQVTLPLTILSAVGDEEFLLLEMGMTKKGHIAKLVEIAPPEIVVLTEITYVHSENFESLEDIAQAKSEIFSVNTKYSVIHKNSANFNAIYRNCLSHNILYPSKIDVISPYKESHLSQNFVAAYEVARYLGMDDNQIRLAALSMVSKKAPHRFEVIKRAGVTFIDDSYNANLLSVTAALENLPKPKEGGRVIFVFGQMSELGSQSPMFHQMVAKKSVDICDLVLCIGIETKSIVEVFEKKGKFAKYFFDFRSLKDGLYDNIKPGDVVLIKGANSLKLWKLLDESPAIV